ncbi:MAG: HAD family hydrolase, partial [Pricia sp.]
MSRLQSQIEGNPQYEIVFTDLFDTLIHRTVHPNYTLKLWAKFMVRELGLTLEVDRLFSIRNEAVQYVSKQKQLKKIEVDYFDVIAEVYQRLINCELISGISYPHFSATFERADYVAETSVQFKNEGLIADVRSLKAKGYPIHLISDFYLPESLIAQILEFHGMTDLFQNLFISCSLGKSKESGTIYPHVLEETAADSAKTVMMGDNKVSDADNAAKYGLHAIHLKHTSHKIRNRKNLFGSDIRAFKKVCREIEGDCRKSPHPFSEYILHFYFFTERLYIKSKHAGVKNLFFLAREGLYLKRLFDAYQKMNRFTGQEKINTHYLKISRHSALQIALKPLKEEDFKAFKGSLGRMSILDFLQGIDISEHTIKHIMGGLAGVSEEVISEFFRSDTFLSLKENATFVAQYEKYRLKQKSAFAAYLESFNVDFEKEGVHLVDVGWGGTMQENLYRYWNRKIPVTGYYLGLKEVYNIQPDTKRYGLNFSIYPSRNHTDDVLMANGQLYEQLLAAPHGSTIGYTDVNSRPDGVYFHEENEKQVFEELIHPVQEFMFVQFKSVFEKLGPIDYEQQTAQKYLTDMALRSGILGKKKNAVFIDQLSRGFYQNVGQNKVGLA